MYDTKSFYILGLSALILMTVCLHDIAALDSPNGLYAPAPGTISGLGCGTSGASDSVQALANSSLVCFIYSPNLGTVTVVGYCSFSGQPGVGRTLTISDVFGLLVKTLKGNVFFLNGWGCPYVVQVFNNNDLVFGYQYFYGYLAFQAFATQTINCPYNCNTFRTADLLRSPNEAHYTAGKTEILVRNLVSYAVYSSSLSPTALQNQVQQYFRRGGYRNINVQAKGQCVIVNDQYIYEQCCTVPRNLSDPNAYVFDSGDSGQIIGNPSNRANNPLCGRTVVKGYSQSRNNNELIFRLYCAYILKSAAYLNNYYSLGFNLQYNIVIASNIGNSVIVIPGFASYTLAQSHAEVFRGYC